MLECKELGFYYNKNNWIFKNINLQIHPGEIVGISGYSGNGKTTLSKVLSGHLKATQGSILINNKISTSKFREVQLILQHPEKAMNPKWKMHKIINESYCPCEEILNNFGIKKEWLSRFPIELSGGELQRFSIVRSLNPKTKYLIADEMTTMLDGITQAEIWNKLISICKSRNIGLIIISHEKAIIDKLCDKVYFMDEISKTEDAN